MRPKLYPLVVVAALSGASCLVTLDLGYDLPDEGTGGTGGAGGAGVCEPGAVEPCYTGPEGTEGVGLCRAGTMTCRADGSGYEECQGETLPTVENCATPTDEDCDGLAPPCNGALLWARAFGDGQDQYGVSISAHYDGSVLLAGDFAGSLNFGGGPITADDISDIFFAMLDSNGEHAHSARFGGLAIQSKPRISARSDGGAMITGQFQSSVDIGTVHTSSGSYDTLLARLGPDGGPVWSSAFGGSGADSPAAVGADAAGNVTLAGTFYSSSIDFGGGPLFNLGGADVFLTQLDSTGQHVWSRRYGTATAQTANDLAVDVSGNIILAGTFAGSVDLGGGTLTSAGGSDFYLAKFDPQGSHLWSARFGGSQNEQTIAISVDSQGSIIVAATISGSVDFGGGPLSSAGAEDIAIAKLDSAGVHQWSRRYGDALGQLAVDVAVDGSSNIIITGQVTGSIDFGGGSLIGAGVDVGLAKLDPGGGHLWSKRLGDSSGSHSPLALAVDQGANVLLTGAFTQSFNLTAETVLTSAGGFDVFVAKFAP